MAHRFYVLVTGATGGIGKATALRLDSQGYHVLAGVLEHENTDDLLEGSSDRLIPLVLDVTNPEQIAAAAEKVAEITGDDGLYGLVNNAGIAVPGPLEILLLDSLRWQFEVNVFGQVAVTQAMLPYIRKAQGRVVMMSSITGKRSFALTGAYGASKHAVLAVADTLRRELQPWGIHVAAILPGVINTNIWESSTQWIEQQIAAGKLNKSGLALYADVLKGEASMANAGTEQGISPEHVAETVLKALTASTPRTRYYVGRDAQFVRTVVNFLPVRWVDAILRRG